MYVGNSKLTPHDVPVFFSLLVGVLTVKFVHAHDVERLIGFNVVWLVWLGLICLRASFRGGKILNIEPRFDLSFAIAFYLIGLLMACVYYLVYS